MRHPISGNGIYSFDIADGRIRAIYVVRNLDKLRGFIEHTHWGLTHIIVGIPLRRRRRAWASPRDAEAAG